MRFDTMGPQRAKGTLTFDQDTGRFHLIGGIEPAPNSTIRTASDVLTLDALAVPFTGWGNVQNWVRQPALRDLQAQIEAYGSDLCAEPRTIYCTDQASGAEIWTEQIQSCSADRQGEVLTCDQEQIPVGYHFNACRHDPACEMLPSPPVCLPGERCGRLPENNTENAAWTYEYTGKGRAGAAAAMAMDTGEIVLFGGHAGCTGSDCNSDENYPDYLSQAQSLQNLGTDRVDAWDARTGAGRSAATTFAPARISGAAADWLGYRWSANTGKWLPTANRRTAFVVGGAVLEEMALRWDLQADTVSVVVNPNFTWASPTGSVTRVMDPDSVGPQPPPRLRERLLTFDGQSMQEVNLPGFPDLLWPAAARINEREFLVAGGELAGNKSGVIFRIDLAGASGPVTALQSSDPLTRVPRAQASAQNILYVAGAQMVVDPIKRYAYVFGGTADGHIVNIIDYDQSLTDEAHRILPIDDVPQDLCSASGPTSKGFQLDTTTRLDTNGMVSYEATMRGALDCVTAPSCYVEGLTLNLGRGHGPGMPANLEVDVDVYVPDAQGNVPSTPTRSETAVSFLTLAPGTHGEPRIEIPAPPSEPWSSGTELHITVRYLRQKFQLTQALSGRDIVGAGVRPLTASENCVDPSNAPDMCAFYLRSVPMYFEADTRTFDASGNERTTPIAEGEVFVNGQVLLPPAWGVSVPGLPGLVSSTQVAGVTYDSHAFRLKTELSNASRSYPPPTIVANQHLQRQVTASAGTTGSCGPQNQVFALSTMMGASGDLAGYLQQGGGTSAFEDDLLGVVAFNGDIPQGHTRVFFLPDLSPSPPAGFNAQHRIEVTLVDAFGTAPDDDFPKTVVHELNHLWFGTSPDNVLPDWVSEGLSEAMIESVDTAPPGKQRRRFRNVLEANIAGASCNVLTEQPTYSSPPGRTLYYDVGYHVFNTHLQVARALNAWGPQADMWNYWGQNLASGEFDSASVISLMDAVAPNFGANYAPAVGCPGVPILAMREFGFHPGNGATPLDEWQNGSGTFTIEQVQTSQYNMPVFTLAPYALSCVSSYVEGAAYVAEQNVPAFNECTAFRQDPATLIDPMASAVPSGTTEIVVLGDVRLMQLPVETVPLTINLNALTGTSGQLIAPAPTHVRLLQTPGLHPSAYASLSNPIVWCGGSKDPLCMLDVDQDQSPGLTDCLDFPIPGLPAPELVGPHGQDSGSADTDMDCNCIGYMPGAATPGNGWAEKDVLGNAHRHCQRLY
ncbi:MAG: hypothetical protein H6993_10600 [Pseudomonadales bacterium]|nr:hypothetical protein [Pseudomonadales bacterium]